LRQPGAAHPARLRDRPGRRVRPGTWSTTELRAVLPAPVAEPGQYPQTSGRRAPCTAAGVDGTGAGGTGTQRRGGAAPRLDRGAAGGILRPHVRLPAREQGRARRACLRCRGDPGLSGQAKPALRRFAHAWTSQTVTVIPRITSVVLHGLAMRHNT